MRKDIVNTRAVIYFDNRLFAGGLASSRVAGMKIKLTVWGYRCLRCGHEWIPREKAVEPRVCPKCKNPYWNTPKKTRKRDT